MSNDPAPATPPEADPPPSRLPALKQGSTQKAGEESEKGREGLYSAAGTVLVIAIGIGIGLWNARQDAQEEKPPIVPVKINAVGPKPLGIQSERARALIKQSITKAAEVRSQEEAASVRELLTTTEKFAKVAAPDLLPEVQQAQRDLAAREPNLPKLAKKATEGEPEQDIPTAPPPREVNQ
jgi:hypothetical protein